MKVQVGCDVILIPRFKKVLLRTPSMIDKVFLPSEKDSKTIETLAGIFAVKEAVIKALRLKAGEWHKISISKDTHGRPKALVVKSRKKIVSQDISISHDGDYVFAIAVFLTNGPFQYTKK